MIALPETPLRPHRKRLRLRRRRLLAVLASLLALLAVYTLRTNTRPYALSASIALDATPEEVWRVLTDLPAYGEWNPFIVSADGTVERDATLHLVMHDEIGDTTFTPLCWPPRPARNCAGSAGSAPAGSSTVNTVS